MASTSWEKLQLLKVRTTPNFV